MFVGNDDEVRFDLSNYVVFPIYHRDGAVVGTDCVLDDQPRDYSEDERGAAPELRAEVEAALLDRSSALGPADHNQTAV